MIIAIQNDEIGEMLKSTVTLQLLFHVYWQLVCWAEKWIPNLGEWTVVLFEIGPKLISDIRRDTMSFDISIALSLAPILHVLRGRQNPCFGNCMGLAKLSNSMSNYIRCLQTLLGDGGLLLLEAITFMFKKSTGFSFWLLRIRNLSIVVFVCWYSVCEVNKVLISVRRVLVCVVVNDLHTNNG